jgi:hypothetical protein
MGPSKWVLGMTNPAIEGLLPNLSVTGYSITSPQDESYNCIAWAAGVDDNWWWPISPYYWPSGISKDNSIQSFVAAFIQQGYCMCDSIDLEPGYEKIALYINAQGRPTHAARQLASGVWSSKLGPSYDIEHQSLRGVEGSIYGTVAVTLKRPIRPTESAEQEEQEKQE